MLKVRLILMAVKISIGRKQSYNTRKERLTESWEKVRGDIFKAFTESSAPPNNCKCYECGSIGEIRCQSCGPFTFYCCECSIKVHKSVNVFHLLEIWKVKLTPVDHYDTYHASATKCLLVYT